MTLPNSQAAFYIHACPDSFNLWSEYFFAEQHDVIGKRYHVILLGICVKLSGGRMDGQTDGRADGNHNAIKTTQGNTSSCCEK